MNTIELVIVLTVMWGWLAYSLRCQIALRDLLAKHGKKPAPPLLSTAMLSHIRLSKELLSELNDEEKIKELKQALARADQSVFLGVVAFLGMGLFFLATKN